MSDSDPSGPAPDNPPTPAASSWAGLPWVWAVPVVAAIIAGWLGYRALIERGPTITIGFVTADGVEPDRTTIRYKNVELGRVTGIGLTPDGSRVVVTAEMRREAEPMLRADSRILGGAAANNPERHHRTDHDRLWRVYRHAARQRRTGRPFVYGARNPAAERRPGERSGIHLDRRSAPVDQRPVPSLLSWCSGRRGHRPRAFRP